MKCPACGTDGSEVSKTLDDGKLIARQRRCACGTRWVTDERVRKGSLVAIEGAGGISLSGNSPADYGSDSNPTASLLSDPRVRVERKTYKYSAEFESAWTVYGQRAEKIRGYQAWKAIAPTVGGERALRELVVSALAWQSHDWAKDNWKFAPYFERYLKRRRFDDERPRMQAVPRPIDDTLSKGTDRKLAQLRAAAERVATADELAELRRAAK